MSEYHFVVSNMHPNIPLCCGFLTTHINLSQGLLPVLQSQADKHIETYSDMLVGNSPIV